MKDLETQSRFVELRASGKSFSSISTELGVSKPTLIKWSKDFQIEILNVRAVLLDEVAERYRLTLDDRLRSLESMLFRVGSELLKREFSDVPSEKLVKTYFELGEQLRKETRVLVAEKDSFEIAQDVRFREV